MYKVIYSEATTECLEFVAWLSFLCAPAVFVAAAGAPLFGVDFIPFLVVGVCMYLLSATMFSAAHMLGHLQEHQA